MLNVERFYRNLHSRREWLLRLPQEDFFYVMCVPSHLKFESDAGLGLAGLAAVLKCFIQAENELTSLLMSQLLFWKLAMPERHANNFGIWYFHKAGTSSYRFAT